MTSQPSTIRDHPYSTADVLSINDDWANLATDVPALLAKYVPFACGVQEGYRRSYRDDLPDRWGIRQRETSDATAGVAVIFDRHRANRINPEGNVDKPHRIGHGWESLLKVPGLRDRGIVWDDLAPDADLVSLLGLPPRLRVASTHRPPVRDRKWWGAFDDALREWLDVSPLPVIVFMDGNEHGGPTKLDRLPRYRWEGHGIDGALLDREIPSHGTPTVLPRLTSDHSGVMLHLGQANPPARHH